VKAKLIKGDQRNNVGSIKKNNMDAPAPYPQYDFSRPKRFVGEYQATIAVIGKVIARSRVFPKNRAIPSSIVFPYLKICYTFDPMASTLL